MYKQKEKGKSAKQQEPEKPSTEPSTEPSKTPTSLQNQVPSLFAEAWAEEINLQFTINTPKAKKITEKLTLHVKDVLLHKRAGLLGETNDGKLILKNSESTKKLLREKIEALLKDENSARQELYDEVVSSNHISSNRTLDVQKSFARSFHAESPAGTWVQDEEGVWSQKE